MWSCCCLLVVLVVPVLGQFSERYVHAECGSVKVDQPLMAGRVGGQRQQTLQPIRISLQYDDNIAMGIMTRLQSNDGPLRSAVRYFQSFLSVYPFNETLRAPPTCRLNVDLPECPTNNLIPPMCGPHVQVPSNHTGPLVTCNADMTICAPPRGDEGDGVANADYVLYISAEQDDTCDGSEPIVGYAGPCVYAEDMDNQPYMGFVNICPRALTMYDEDFVNLFVTHELTHALVFLDKLLNLFPNHTNPLMTSQVGGQSVQLITTPNVVAATREHFNCPNSNGARLENEGGSLTQGLSLLRIEIFYPTCHWESHLFFPELMNGILYQHLTRYTNISNITLSLFTDSGWYSVDPTGVDFQLLWGSGLGCEFTEEQCNNAYRCMPCCDDYIQCASHDARALGYCTRPPLHDGCSIVMPRLFCSSSPDGELLEDFIPGDVSIAGSTLVFNVQSICTEAGKPSNQFNVNCVGRRCVQIEGTDLVALAIVVNEVEQWCRRPDEFIFNGTVRCPPVASACATGAINTIPTSDPIPPPLCHETCETCQTPQDAAACISCYENRRLNGGAPSTCIRINDVICEGNFYLDNTSQQCTECPMGCALCNGPQNTDCFACSNDSLFRDTTNKLDSPCVASCPSDRDVMGMTDQFGRRRCVDLVTPSTPPFPTTPPTDSAMAITGTALGLVICIATAVLLTTL